MKIERNTFGAALFVFASALFLPGCLILADHPKVGVGEHCAVDKNCPAGTSCQRSSDGTDTICLPPTPECAVVDDPKCLPYKCDVTYQACRTGCNSFSDCASGYICDFDYSAGSGVCAVTATP